MKKKIILMLVCTFVYKKYIYFDAQLTVQMNERQQRDHTMLLWKY